MTHFAVCVALTEGPFDFVVEDGQLTKEQSELIQAAVAKQLEPFDENGEWFADGSRWDWWVIGGRYEKWWYCGPVVKLRDLSLTKQQEHDRKEAVKFWGEAEGREELDRDLIWGIKPGDTLESYTERSISKTMPVPCTAFVRDRNWYENGRTGWFGDTIKTECEIHTGETPEICRFRHQESEAIVTTYSLSEEAWRERWFDRFIKDLPPETLLVLVDCHV